jgi:hypothetical protein
MNLWVINWHIREMLPNTWMPLDKIDELCRIISGFAGDAIWDYQIVRFAGTEQDLLARAEEFDIKNEQLFNQFEQFLSNYKEFVDALGINTDALVAALSDEGLQKLGDLVNTLETRFERIMNNEYLNVSPELGYEEDFDPADFRELLSDIIEDANNRLQAAAGETDISALKALEIAKDLNQEQADRRDDKMHFTGDKAQQAITARQNYLDKLKDIRRLGKGGPAHQKLIEMSRRNYRMIMEDPARKEAYREKARQRQATHWQKLTPEKQKAKWQSSYEHLQRLRTMFQTAGVPSVERLRGGIIQLGKNIINVRMGIKKKITPGIKARLAREESTFFKPLLDKVSDARSRGDAVAIKVATDALDKAMQKRANELANAEPEMMEYESRTQPYTDFVDQLADISSRIQKLSSEKTRPEEMPDLHQLRDDIRAASGTANKLKMPSVSPSRSFVQTLTELHPILLELDRQLSGALSQ